MVPQPPQTTRTYTLFPNTTLFRSPSAITTMAATISRRRRRVPLPLFGGFAVSVWVFMTRLRRHRWRPAWGNGELQTCRRSEEHTSEIQSLMRNSYAVFCLKKIKRAHTELDTLAIIMNYNNNN